MNRSERKRQAKEDEKHLTNGLDPDATEAQPIAAMARLMHSLFEKAKRSGTTDEAVKFLYAKAAASLSAKPVTVACGRGCAHCCNGFVSVSVPEIFFAARRARSIDGLPARVSAAEAAIGAFAFAERPLHPHPCPMLEDNSCGLYEARPFACRLASSVDAGACARVFRLLAAETIPAPVRHIRTREFYQLATASALARAGLPHRFYDFTGGLARALEVDHPERAWLSGENIFEGVQMDPTDLMSKASAQAVYRHAFG